MLKQDLKLQTVNFDLMEDKIDGKIKNEFVTLWAKTYCYLTNNNDEDKKAKDTKKCIIKTKLKFEDYKTCLKPIQLENKIYQKKKKKLIQNVLERTTKNL